MVVEISVTLIGLVAIAVIGLYIGAKNGFAKGISDFIAWAVVTIVLRIVLYIYNGYTEGKTMDIVVALVVLIALGLIYGVVKIVLKSVRALSDLPVIAIIDKLLGAALGLIVVILLFYVIVTACRFGYFGKTGATILNDVENDEWLSYIARFDLVNKIVEWKNNLFG